MPVGNDVERTDYRNQPKYAALIPVFGFILVVAIVSIVDSKRGYQSPALLLALNTLFLSLVPLASAFLTARSYIASGSMSVLLLGCGLLTISSASFFSGWIIGTADGPNNGVTVYNTGLLLSSLFHLIAAGSALRGYSDTKTTPRQRATHAAVAYVGSISFVCLIAVAAVKDLTPVFFIQGEGPTIIRQIILGLATTFFGVSSAVFMAVHVRRHVEFLYWYSLSLALLSEGLGVMLFLQSLGSPLNWTGRAFQYIGGVYFFIAVVVAFKEARTKGISIQSVLPQLVDVAELRKAEEALKEIQERYRSIYENSIDGIMLTITDGRIIAANQAACEILGRSEKEICQIGRSGIVDESDPQLRKLTDERARNGKCRGELTFIRSDGTRIPVEVSSAVYKDRVGLDANILVFRDVSKRKKMEDDLRNARDDLELRVQERTAELAKTNVALFESERKFRLIAETVQDVFWMYAPLREELIYVSPAYESIWGRPQDHIYNAPESFVDTIHPEDREKVRLSVERHAEGKGKQLEYRIVKPDGAIRWISDQSYPVLGEDGTVALVVGSARDITDRKKAEESLQDYAEKLELLNQQLQEFTFVASHDLQEPLRKVQAFGNMLKSKFSQFLPDEAKDYLTRMQNAANRMQELILALLNYSRIATRPNPFQPTNLAEVFRETVSDMELSIQERGAKVEIDDLPIVEIDVPQVRQLFQNLISNSIRFCGEEKTPLIKVFGAVSGEKCEIHIEDNGIGFEEQYLDRIFRPFQRLHGRSAYEGTGMGLAICKKIVERHGGSITAKSSPNQGSTFIITLPLEQERSQDTDTDGIERISSLRN